MKKLVRFAFAFALALGLLSGTAGTTLAEHGDTVPYCAGDSVDGSLVEVDEESGWIVILTETGECKVDLAGESDSPIAPLFDYFAETDSESLNQTIEDALLASTICVVDNGDETYHLAVDEEECTDVMVQEIQEDDTDGTYLLCWTPEAEDGALEEPETICVDAADDVQAGEIQTALDSLLVSFSLLTGEDGNTVLGEGSALAEALHEDGRGWGLLVKWFSIASECDVSVEEIQGAFESGMGMGNIFKQYCRPSMMGVGHLRHSDGTPGNGLGPQNANHSNNGHDNTPGYCKEHGNGNGNGNGPKNKDCE